MSKKTTNNHEEFFMSFFEKKEGYDEKQINGFWLIKLFDGNEKKWRVNLFSQESYANYNRARNLFGVRKEQNAHLRSIT